MSGGLTGTAVKLPTWWAHVYTAGLPPDAREARREEIVSDVYEQLHDCEGLSPGHRLAFDISWAVVRGVPHDLMWRTALLSPGWWLFELIALSVGMGIAGMFLAALPYLAGGIGNAPVAVTVGLAAGLTSGLAMAIALRRYRPLNLTAPGQPQAARPVPDGDPLMNLGFRKWTGISLLISALLMVLTIAFQIAHGVNPFDEPAELLPKIDDESVLWVANYAAGMAIPLFLLPVFVLLATDTNSGARQWGLFATGLAAIHIAILGIAYGSQILLVPLASDVAGATDTELATIYAQADTLHHAWVIFTMISGLPMAIALWVLGVVTFRTRMIPRWLGIVAVVLGVGYMPPLASGENPLVPPLLLVLTVGTAYILLRRPPSHVSRPEAPPTTITASNTA